MNELLTAIVIYVCTWLVILLKSVFISTLTYDNELRPKEYNIIYSIWRHSSIFSWDTCCLNVVRGRSGEDNSQILISVFSCADSYVTSNRLPLRTQAIRNWSFNIIIVKFSSEILPDLYRLLWLQIWPQNKFLYKNESIACLKYGILPLQQK